MCCVAELPDTSIADTSTEEDLNVSQTSLPDSDKEEKAEKQEVVREDEKQEAETEADKKPEEKEEAVPEPEPVKEDMEVKYSFFMVVFYRFLVRICRCLMLISKLGTAAQGYCYNNHLRSFKRMSWVLLEFKKR